MDESFHKEMSYLIGLQKKNNQQREFDKHFCLAINPDDFSSYSPEDISNAASAAMSENRHEVCRALNEVGLALYPNDRYLLTEASLLAVTEQNWSLAVERFEKLFSLYGDILFARAYYLFAESLQAYGSTERARYVISEGLKKYPNDDELLMLESRIQFTKF